MDLFNRASVSGGKTNGSSTTNTLNVIAPDHPFWSQALSSQKMSMLHHQFFTPTAQTQQEIHKESKPPNDGLGLSNLKIVAHQPFQNNGIENNIHLDDMHNLGSQPTTSNYPNNLRLAPIGSSRAYQVSEMLPNFDLIDNPNHGTLRSPQSRSVGGSNKQLAGSPHDSPKSYSPLSTDPTTQVENQMWPERSQLYSRQQQNQNLEASCVGPRFNNTTISKPKNSAAQNISNIPSTAFASKINQQQQQPPPRLRNMKYKKSATHRNGTHLTEKPYMPMQYDDSSISLSSTDDEEVESEEEYDSTDTGVWLYISKSNIWIESKKQSKITKNNKTNASTEDKKLRLDLGKLTELIRKGRQIIDIQCYGSEPPEVDTIWKVAKKKGWDSLGPKSASKYESQLDVSVSNDIMELVGCSHLKNLRFEKCKNVVVLIANENEDLPKIIGKIINQEGWWKIEIWSTKSSISNYVKELASDYPDIIEINYYDREDLKQSFQFTHYRLDLKDKLDKIDKRWVYNYGIVFEDVNLEIGSYVCDAFQNTMKGLNWPYKYVWMRDPKNKAEVHLNLLVLFERPNAINGKEKSDFLGEHLPKLKTSLLSGLCHRIVSYHEFNKEKEDDMDEISFTNRYSFLSDVKDEEEDSDSSEMFDEPINDPFDLIQELEKEEEADTSNAIKDTEWEQVIHKQRGGGCSSPPVQVYAIRCIYGYICTYGTKCHYEHTKDEKQVFDARTTAKKIGKVPFHDNKYRTELCNFNIPHDRAACPFAHGMTQMICKACYKCGHSVETCNIKETLTP